MAQTINTLQMYAPKSWSGLTTENHLGTVFAQQPTLVSNIMSRVFGLNQYTGMDYFLSMGMEEELPDDNDFEWFLKGDDEKAVRILGYTCTNLTGTPGLGGAIIELVLAEKYFAATDKLVFDDTDY